MITIRKVPIDSDLLEDVRALDRATLPESVPSPDTHWWGAFDDLDLVGYAGGRWLETGAYFLSRAGVKPSHRGLGIQRALIHARVSHGRRNLAPRVVTYTVNDNWPSMNNLIRCGFLTYDPPAAFAGDDVVYWRRRFV